MLKRLFYSLIIVFFLFLLSIFPAQAQTEFSTSYNIQYTVLNSGVTQAKYSIGLINRLSNIYATEFSLSIGSTKISNIKAYTASDSLDAQSTQGSKTTNITIPFKEQVVGKNKSNDFFLEFDSRDFANQLGNIWEISIPRLSETDDLKDYQLNLTIPLSFGKPAFINPSPINTSVNDGYITYYFSSEDLLKKGVSATFGEKQYFDFSLQYNLENPNIYPAKTELALPPDTPFQQIIYQSLNPLPEDINIDEDGNWMAVYNLKSKENLTITATGSAQISLSPRPDFPKTYLKNIQDYLKPQQYWEVDHPKIKELTETVVTPQSIYQYVVNNLIYDYGRLGEDAVRFGAVNILDNPDSAICMEFSDLFITLARANNIPARNVNGFAYTTNSALRPLSLKKDVLHAWPEYYDDVKNLWIPVDPTWGNTTGGIDYFSQFDLNHFAFAFQGINSDYPPPAGAYKTDNQNNKDINITFGKPVTAQPQTKLRLQLAKQSIAGLPLTAKITLINTGNVAVYNQTINLTANRIKIKPNQWQVPLLPPFTSKTFEFQIPPASWSSKFTATITAISNSSSDKQQTSFVPVHSFIFQHPITFKILSLLIGISILWFVSRLVIKYKK